MPTRVPSLPDSANSATLSVAAGVGAVYTIPTYASGVTIQVSGANVFYRAGASTLAASDIDITGTATDACLVDGFVGDRSRGPHHVRLAFMTASGTAVVLVTPYIGG